MPNPYYIEPADVVGRFRQGAGEARVGQGRYADAARIDPANANSYMALEDRETARQDRQEQRAFGRSYADAYNRGDFAEAGNVAAQHGSIEGVTAARTGRQEASEQERLEAWRALQGYATRLEALEGNPNAQAEWGAMLEEAITGSAQSPELQAQIQRFPRDWNVARTRVPDIVRTWMERLLTPQQLSTLQNQRETRENQDWSMDAYGRPYRNNGGFIERRNEAGEIVRDEAPVPMPRDRVPLPATYGESGLNAEGVRAEREYARDWRGVFEDFSSIRSEFGRIEQMASRRDSAGDLALVVSFTKMLDPGSVAREGEVALTQSAASTLAQVTNFLPRLQQGNTLLPDQVRNQLLEAARQMYGVYQGAYNRLGEDYQQTAQQYGFDPSRVMRGWEPPQRGALGGRNDAWIANEGGRRPSQTPANPGVGLQSMTDEQLDALERELQNAGR